MSAESKPDVRVSKREVFKSLLVGVGVEVAQGVSALINHAGNAVDPITSVFTKGGGRFQEASAPTVTRLATVTAIGAATGIDFGYIFPNILKAASTPWEAGRMQTYPEIELEDGSHAYQNVDIGTIGPDVDHIFGFDFKGNIPTGALEIYTPSGRIDETRVIGAIRTDLLVVQFRRVRRGDSFQVYRVSDYGGDAALDKDAREHAANSARTHQKVIYIGDLGLFERQYGPQEIPLLSTIIRAQYPPREDLKIGVPNFVKPPTLK